MYLQHWAILLLYVLYFRNYIALYLNSLFPIRIDCFVRDYIFLGFIKRTVVMGPIRGKDFISLSAQQQVERLAHLSRYFIAPHFIAVRYCPSFKIEAI